MKTAATIVVTMMITGLGFVIYQQAQAAVEEDKVFTKDEVTDVKRGRSFTALEDRILNEILDAETPGFNEDVFDAQEFSTAYIATAVKLGDTFSDCKPQAGGIFSCTEPNLYKRIRNKADDIIK